MVYHVSDGLSYACDIDQEKEFTLISGRAIEDKDDASIYKVLDYITFEGNKYPVTMIADQAFDYNCGIKQIELPVTIKQVGEKAFLDPNIKIINNIQNEKSNLKKGDIIKTSVSDHTIVLDVKDHYALLFTGTQFIKAHGCEVKDNKLSWGMGQYCSSIDEIPKDYENMEFDDFKNQVAAMLKENDMYMVKSLISVENGVKDNDLINAMYQRFDDEKFNLLNDSFDEIHAELTCEESCDYEDEWEQEM